MTDSRDTLTELEAARAERDKLQAFKTWVHAYLDSHGVPHHPPGTHGAEGCRIGDRMDWLMAELAECRRRCEGLVERVAQQGELLTRRAGKQPTWTKRTPSEMGWYWWRPSLGFLPTVAHIRNDWLLLAGEGRGQLPESVGGEWCGPLWAPGGDAVENCGEGDTDETPPT